MIISRRRFLKLTGLGLAAGAVGGRFLPLVDAVASAQGVGLASPVELGRRPGPGVVRFDLAASPATVSVAGRTARLWTYNGGFPGPTLRLWEGDRVELRFSNGLPEVTNLHFHGLHIPPTGNGDNVFRQVAPGETALYEFSVPEGSAGTFWYHPHVHGTVASQLFRGLAGAIVVEGPADAVFGDLPEQLLVLKDFEFNARGDVAPHGMMDWSMGREGSLVTVNGEESPSVEVSGGALRLRLLNASNARYYRLAIPSSEITVIASDGGFVAKPYRATELLLAPGERYEVVASFPSPGEYHLVTLPYDRAPEDDMAAMGGIAGMGGTAGMGGMAGMPGMGQGAEGGGMGAMPGHDMGAPGMGMPGGAPPAYSAAAPLTRFVVRESGDYVPPRTLAAIEPLRRADAVISRRLVLAEDMAAARFFIDGKEFDPDRVDVAPRLGTVEHWEIVNDTGMDHPMHLHVHPFQLLAGDGTDEGRREWKDVVNVPARGSVEILVPFRDFVGKTVFHCHVVEHEDRGMMSVVDVR